MSASTLRGKQIVFLQCLAKKALTRKALCKAAKAHPTNVTANALGATGEDARKNRDKANGYPCLITLGYVRMKDVDVDGKSDTLYEITANGRKALERAKREAADK